MTKITLVTNDSYNTLIVSEEDGEVTGVLCDSDTIRVGGVRALLADLLAGRFPRHFADLAAWCDDLSYDGAINEIVAQGLDATIEYYGCADKTYALEADGPVLMDSE